MTFLIVLAVIAGSCLINRAPAAFKDIRQARAVAAAKSDAGCFGKAEICLLQGELPR